MLWQMSMAWFMAIASDVSFFFFFGFKIDVQNLIINFLIGKTFGSFSLRIICFGFLFLSFGFGMFGPGLSAVWWSEVWRQPDRAARRADWSCDYFLIDLETLAWPQTLTLNVSWFELHNINRLIMDFKWLSLLKTCLDLYTEPGKKKVFMKYK